MYTFEWLDEVMDSMYKNGIYVILATPSAGKPPWLIKKYPDIMRTRAHRQRMVFVTVKLGIDCWKVSEILDVISFDKYPHWHNGADKTSEWAVGVESAFAYDYCRSMQNKPFLLMESSPSSTNWMPVAKLKRPGIHMLGSMQAIAGGADSVQYFQWRQSRGAFEKFHGSVVTHNGSEHTRVFQDVTQVGARLADLAHVKNTETKARVAIIFDWDNLRGLDEQKSLRNVNRDFEQVIMEHYEAV